MLDPYKIKQLLLALKNAESQEEEQQIMAQYKQYSVISGANNMALSVEEEQQIAQYFQEKYGVTWQSGNVEISLQEAIDIISGRPGTNIPVNQQTYTEAQGDKGKSQNAMENKSGITATKTTEEKVDELFQHGGWVDESGKFRDSNGNLREDLPNFGDYLYSTGKIVKGYYENGTAGIEYNGKLYPAYTAPKKEQQPEKNAEKQAEQARENNKNYLGGIKDAMEYKNSLLEEIPGAKYWPFSKETETTEYDKESMWYKTGYFFEMSAYYGDIIRDGMGYNATYKMPPKMGGNSATKGSGKAETGANNVADFEKLRSSLAAKEIVNAERTSTALSKSDPGHLAASFLSEEQLAAGRTFSIRGGDGVQRTLLQTEGELNGNKGIYEYILEPGGKVSHQRFIQDGKITGSPNQVVPKGGK